MTNLPERRHEAALAKIDHSTAEDIQAIRGAALSDAATIQAIGYVTECAEKEALSIALTETLVSQLAPHAAERFRILAEAGTQALIVKVMHQGR